MRCDTLLTFVSSERKRVKETHTEGESERDSERHGERKNHTHEL